MKWSILIGCAFILFNFSSANAAKFNNFSFESDPYLKSISKERDTSKFEKIYKELPPLFQETMIACPEKIWPGYSWKDINVFLLEAGQPAQVWQGKDNSVIIVSDSEFPQSSYQGIFDFFTWSNQPAVALNPGIAGGYSFDSEGLFGLGIHEGFHYLGQQGWASKEGPRGTLYPVDYQPRLYRRMLFDRLMEYFTSRGTEKFALYKAAYWFDQWAINYPSETLSTTDGYEGTARYVELLALEYSRSKCAAPDDVVLDHLVTDLPTDLGFTMNPKVFVLDAEGYDVGSLSAFTLQWIQKNLDWPLQMTSGVTPLDVLMNPQHRVPDTITPQLEAEYIAAADVKNKQIAGMLGTFITDYTDRTFVRINLAGSSASFSPKGFFLPKSLPGVTTIPLAMDVQLQAAASSITIKRDAVAFSADTPCADPSFMILVPKSELAVTDGKLDIHSATLDGVLHGSVHTDANGYEWFCGTN